MGQTIVLMIGIPGSGKTTYIRNALQAETVSAVRVSRDDIRKALLGEVDPKNNGLYFSKEDEVFDNFVRLVNEAIEDGVERVYVDATHISPASREKILSRINKREQLGLEAVIVSCATNVAQARNMNRAGFARVPQKAIENMAKGFTAPTIAELSRFKFKNLSIKECGDKYDLGDK